MSTRPVFPSPSTSDSPSVLTQAAPPSTQPSRSLACVRCQSRKVRCDHKSPCTNCIKGQAECVPATLATRRRRKRFSEKALLERLRNYESLLREHGITFQPTHDSSGSESENRKAAKLSSPSVGPSFPAPDLQPVKPGNGNTFWRAIHQGIRSPGHQKESSDEEFVESRLRAEWDDFYDGNDHILFCAGMAPKNITSYHPEPVDIFRLWQIYVDNINPILKITHAPTIQQQIIEASGHLSEVSPDLEALMFGIYCTALMSISDEDCSRIFAEDRDTLNHRYQSGCQQALINANYLRTSDLRVLAALLLYLLSIRPGIDPRSLSSIVGIAVRIGQTLGLHAECFNKEFSPFEAEMRRRLWWQIVLFDSRMGEMANCKSSILSPTWDCDLPLNLNDSDLIPHLKELVTPREGPTEALFIMISCEIANFVRNSQFYLKFTLPSTKESKSTKVAPSVDDLEALIENKYLKYCNPHIPLHLMSSCMSRGFIGKWRFGEYLFNKANNLVSQPVEYRDKIFLDAIQTIECDTAVYMTPITKGFLWFTKYHLPFPAYSYLIQELRRSTTGECTERAWQAIALNFEERDMFTTTPKSKLFKTLCHMLVKAWEARESALVEKHEACVTPTFITNIRSKFSIPEPRHSQIDPENILSTFPPSIPPEMQRPVASDSFVGPVTEGYAPGAMSVDVEGDLMSLWPMEWQFMNASMDHSWNSS
ncbi:hypothetical protein V491_06658 [Pseudogymnoascus sp. VKM F-3775]|nr:hypothetical protein V491_06658 [Pseudogymnoascus sp. VKM F-3775]